MPYACDVSVPVSGYPRLEWKKKFKLIGRISTRKNTSSKLNYVMDDQINGHRASKTLWSHGHQLEDHVKDSKRNYYDTTKPCLFSIV